MAAIAARKAIKSSGEKEGTEEEKAAAKDRGEESQSNRPLLFFLLHCRLRQPQGSIVSVGGGRSSAP